VADSWAKRPGTRAEPGRLRELGPAFSASYASARCAETDPNLAAMLTNSRQALATNCDEFDTKPIDFDRLLQKIERVLVDRASSLRERTGLRLA
jgi:CheY-like chemotaxis protein